MEKGMAFGIVLQELLKCDLFCGKYDAKHGKEDFMYGVGCVIEAIASRTNDEIFDAVSEMFTHNLIVSEEKAKIVACEGVECSGHCYSCPAAAL